MDPPHVDIVRLTDTALEVWIEPSSPTCLDHGKAIPPFESGSGPGYWRLPRSADVASLLLGDSSIAAVQAPAPALVTLGRDGDGLVLLDIEHAGSLEIFGGEASEIVHSIMLELATVPWSDQVELVLAGLDEQLEGMERVRTVPALTGLIPELRNKVEERRTLMNAFGRSSNWASRWTDDGDAWDLIAVVVAPWAAEADPQALAELISLSGDGSCGVVAVVGRTDQGAGARWSVRADGGPIDIGAPGFRRPTLSPQSVDAAIATGVASLVDVARHLEGASPSDAPYDELTMPVPDFLSGTGEPVSRETEPDLPAERRIGSDRRSSSETGREEVEEPSAEVEVEVRILGPVEIVGALRPFSRAWTRELVVYLAVHPGGVSTDQWATALWPERAMAASSLHSTVSAARRALGVAANGLDHLPRSHGRLALGPSVDTDWRRFVQLSSTSDPACWDRALCLVRGRPFDGLRAADWALLEGIEATIEAGVVDLACRMAEHALTIGDPVAAERAARRALRVSPYDERLFRLLMRSADRAGNPGGVEAVMAELVHLVADEVEPWDAVHPETLELYRSLSRRSGAARLASPSRAVGQLSTRR
jgi:DNA-binding SARP family transcriptional activator